MLSKQKINKTGTGKGYRIGIAVSRLRTLHVPWRATALHVPKWIFEGLKAQKIYFSNCFCNKQLLCVKFY